MTGFPAFQSGAFQADAFQTGQLAVASPYSLGSPVFAAPSLVSPILHANTYTLGSPVFSTPSLTVLQLILHANPYSLGSPVFAQPLVQQYQFLHANNYSTQSPVFSGASPFVQTYYLFANFSAVDPPVYATPVMGENYVFSSPAYTLASPIFAFVDSAGIVDRVCHTADYILDFPRIARPALQQALPQALQLLLLQEKPPFFLEVIDEAVAILNGMLQDVLASVPQQFGHPFANLQEQVGALIAGADVAIRSGMLSAPLYACFEAARAAGATLNGMEKVRQDLLLQNPQSVPGIAVQQAGIVFALVEDSKIITTMTFVSRDDISVMMDRMQAAFEPAIETAADVLDSASYQTILALYGSVTNWLAGTQLQLPLVVTYTTGQPTPALWLANYIYGDGSRYDELIAENKVVNPAFCPRVVRALSA